MDRMGGGPSIDFGLEEVMQMMGQWPLAARVLIIGLGPGIGEELWCRGFLGRGLLGRYGLYGGILFTSFFFGLIHLHPTQGLMAMMMGICLHYIYVTSRSLLLPMLLHFLNNSLSVLAPDIPTLRDLDKSWDQIPAVFWVGALVLAAAVGYALYQ